MMEISERNTRIGWIGTGVMGCSMVQNLMRAGFSLSITSRTQSKAQPLIDAGAKWCDTPAEVAQGSDVICSMVGYPDDVREVHFGEHGTLTASRAGQVLVDFTTSSPSLATELATAGIERGVTVLDAPVSGGDIGARNGTLSIMVGGDAATFAALQPLWQAVGKTFVHQGPPGSGQHTKMVNQTLIASNMIGVCEALLYAHRVGLDLDRVLESVASGAAGSWSLSNLGPRILRGDFDPGFFVEHFIKDMGIALDEANRMQLALPGLALARQLYVSLAAIGGARLGTQALHLALARMSGVSWTGSPLEKE
jgi:3-hydroxyisobutyrate dehydrogenase